MGQEPKIISFCLGCFHYHNDIGWMTEAHANALKALGDKVENKQCKKCELPKDRTERLMTVGDL